MQASRSTSSTDAAETRDTGSAVTARPLWRLGNAYARWAETMASAPLFARTEHLVRQLAYLWCLLSVVVLLPVADQIWGPDSYALSMAQVREFPVLVDLDLLSRPALAPHYRWFVGGYIVCLVAGLFGKAPRLMSLMVLALHHVLKLKGQAVADGGDNLMSQMLFYLAVCAWAAPWNAAPAHVVRNLGFISLRIQLCVMYATAGLTKWTGTLWPEGRAIYYVLHTDEYTLPLFRDLMGTSALLLALTTYAVVFFQLAFPLLIWRDPTRRIMMALGAFIHLQIALVMGLMSFGLAMVVSYAVFYTDGEAGASLQACRRWSGRARARIRGLWRAARRA